MPQETSYKSGNEVRFDAPDEAEILQAFCRTRLTALPPGSRGLRAATKVLGALPAACNLGWPDMTVSAPQLFRMFRHAGLVSNEPSACDMPAALRLVASVCELVVQRSPRRWTVWFSRACDPDDALFVSIRKAVTSAMLIRSSHSAPPESRPRTRSARAERTRLAEEIERVKAESASVNERYLAAQAETESAKAEAKTARVQMEGWRAETNAARAGIANAKAEAKAARAEIAAAKAEAKTARAEMAKAMSDAKAARAETAHTTSDAKAARAEIASAKADAKAARAEIASAKADAKAARVQMANAKADAKAARAEIVSAKADAKAARVQMANATADAKAARAETVHARSDAQAAHQAYLQREQELEALQQTLKQSRHETDKFRQAELSLEGKYLALQTEFRNLRAASVRYEQQLKHSRDQAQTYADYTSRFGTVLHKIQNILAIESFDPNELDIFVGTVEKIIVEEREHTKLVTTACAYALDKQITDHFVAYEKLVLRFERVPKAERAQAFQKHTPNLRRQILDSANRIRNKLEQQGVHLPPAQAHL